jgi:PKHD-type hydroxylase
MFLEMPSLLRPDEVGRCTALAETLSFVGGRVSNQGNSTKHNLQVDRDSPNPQGHLESARIDSEALGRSRGFGEFAFPKRVSQVLLSRYDTGMICGAHADAAFLPVTFGVLRTDISATGFIPDPPSYDGGELMVRLGTRNVGFKGGAGGAIVYPSTKLHAVLPVSASTRVVSVVFIESMIADEYLRSKFTN